MGELPKQVVNHNPHPGGTMLPIGPDGRPMAIVSATASNLVPTTKVCNGCLIEKDLEFFSIRRSGRKAGKPRSRCKECEVQATRAYRAADPDAELERTRAWTRNNPEKSRAKTQRWRDRHPDKVKAQNTSPERRAAISRWKKNNPEKVRESSRDRSRSRMLLDDPQSLEYMNIVLLDPCSYCGVESNTVDHIVPRARGGTHEWDNLTGACGTCNSSKHARSLLIHLLKRRSS